MENGGPIFTSTDSGATWAPRESNRSWSSVASSANGINLAAAEQNGQIYTSVGLPIPLATPPTILGATNQVIEATGVAGTKAYDATPNHHDGTLVNGPARVGSGLPFGGYALSFDGVDDYVFIGAPPVSNSWTAEFWVNRRDALDSAALLVSDQTALKLEQAPPARLVGFTKYGVADYSFNYAVPTNTWVHLAFVSDTATRLYVNGVLQGTLSQTIPLPLKQLGARGLGTGDRLKATIDEVRVWSVARSQAQIQASMNQRLSAAEPGLVAYWCFDDWGAVAMFNVTATNVCQPNVPVTCTPASGSAFPPGTTNTVTCVAVNALGVTNTATFTVTVLPTPPVLAGCSVPAPGQVLLQATGTPGLSYCVLAATNVALPLANWTLLGSATEISPGQFQFQDSAAANYPTRYYRLRWPCSLVVSPPTLSSVARQPDRSILVKGAGTAGLTYTLQTSTNLVDWENHTNVVADPGGLIECVEHMDTNAPACFYRLRWP